LANLSQFFSILSDLKMLYRSVFSSSTNPSLKCKAKRAAKKEPKKKKKQKKKTFSQITKGVFFPFFFILIISA